MGTERTYQLIKNATGPGSGTMDWGRLVWIADRARSGVGSTVGFVEILPGTGNPLHRHNTCSEIMVVLEGRISHAVGDETVELGDGDALVVPPGMSHGAYNTGTATARMIVVYDSGERDFEVAG